MKISVLKSGGDNLEFLLEESTPALANALRRIMISEIPTLAVEWVDFHENSSALYDEVVAHRLAMIPLVFSPDKFNFSEDCKCGGEGCSLCQVVFAAEKTGPCNVYSGDMKSSNRDVKPKDGKFPITELLKGQKIRFEAVARLGTGKKHAKFQAANTSYQYYPEVKILKDDFMTYLRNIPRTAFDVAGKKITIKDYSKIDIIKKAAEESVGAIEVVEDPSRFIFRIESISGLTPEYITLAAAKLLAQKAEDFKKKVAKI